MHGIDSQVSSGVERRCRSLVSGDPEDSASGERLPAAPLGGPHTAARDIGTSPAAQFISRKRRVAPGWGGITDRPVLPAGQSTLPGIFGDAVMRPPPPRAGED
jgi:hypothetical protein